MIKKVSLNMMEKFLEYKCWKVQTNGCNRLLNNMIILFSYYHWRRL